MSRKANIVCIVICLVVILAVIGAIIYGAIRNSSDTPPDETQPPITDTTEPEDSGTEPTIPNIPDIEPDDTGDNDQKPANPGDVTIDIYIPSSFFCHINYLNASGVFIFFIGN